MRFLGFACRHFARQAVLDVENRMTSSLATMRRSLRPPRAAAGPMCSTGRRRNSGAAARDDPFVKHSALRKAPVFRATSRHPGEA